MDEYSDYNPQYCIEGVTFRLYNSEEIKALSVKEIKNLDTFDNLQQPTSGGLYDPALGEFCKNIDIQWNLGNSNANFSKLPDFSKTTDGPEFFHYNLLQKYH